MPRAENLISKSLIVQSLYRKLGAMRTWIRFLWGRADDVTSEAPRDNALSPDLLPLRLRSCQFAFLTVGIFQITTWHFLWVLRLGTSQGRLFLTLHWAVCSNSALICNFRNIYKLFSKSQEQVLRHDAKYAIHMALCLMSISLFYGAISSLSQTRRRSNLDKDRQSRPLG